MGRSAGALTDHDGLAPLTKNVNRVPVSRQNCANAPTTGTLVPSSTVSANWLPSPGSRVSTPAGGGIRPTGIFHLMGTARMSEDPRRGVTGSFGAFHGVPGLFVTDASTLPGPVGINPMETIVALALRDARHLLGERQRWGI